MKQNDEERYAAFLVKEDNAERQADPLMQVCNIRKQQLLLCDLEKRKDMAQMMEQDSQTDADKRKP